MRWIDFTIFNGKKFKQKFNKQSKLLLATGGQDEREIPTAQRGVGRQQPISCSQ